MISVNNFENYINNFPIETQLLLKQLRIEILKAAPESTEGISYGMPVFKYFGVLVYMAAFRNHIGFYPGVSAMLNFKDKLTNYKTSKGTIQFSLENPLPAEIISEIVKFKVNENILKFKSKQKKSN